MSDLPKPLPEWAQVSLGLFFGALCVFAIRWFDAPRLPRFDLLVLAGSVAALGTSIAWVAALAIRRGGGWAWVAAFGVLVPYVNFVIASVYVRRYWSDDGRGPGWLFIVGTVAQVAVSLRIIVAHPAALV